MLQSSHDEINNAAFHKGLRHFFALFKWRSVHFTKEK